MFKVLCLVLVGEGGVFNEIWPGSNSQVRKCLLHVAAVRIICNYQAQCLAHCQWQVMTTIIITAAKSLQSCLTLCNPIDGSPPGSPVPGILQARILEWVAISFSNAWRWKMKVKSLSRVRLWVTPRTAAYRAPPSMGFSRQEYWSGVPSPSPIIITNIVI